MDKHLIWSIRDKNFPATFGNKAKNLRRLVKLGCKVPKTWAISWEAYQRYAQDDASVIEDLRAQLSLLLQPGQRYAVRSSANVEDQLEDSFAGQFKSILNITGVDEVLNAIWAIWSTASSPRILDYLARRKNGDVDLLMGVIVQEMVTPIVSGVVFSKNPLNSMNEIIIEAVQGSGEALVQSGATPYRWIYRWDEWVEGPANAPLPPAILQEIVDQTQRIASRLKINVDLEWVYNGVNLFWVQAREITSLKDLTVYSNRISRDMLPGMIKPLVWSVNVPMVNQVWINLLTELIGPNDLKPDDLAKAFYFRTYFNMSKFGQIFTFLGLPPESLEMMLGLVPAGHKRPPMKMSLRTVSHLPRLLRFIADKARFSRKVDLFLKDIEARTQAVLIEVTPQLAETELLARIEQVKRLAQEVAYYNIIVPLAMNIYHAILRRQLKGSNTSYDQLDLLHDLEAIEAFMPNLHLHRLKQEFLSLEPDLQTLIREGGLATLEQLAARNAIAGSFRAHFRDFLDRFGHLSDSGNDFSSVPWRERPETILQMAIAFPADSEENKSMVKFKDVRLPGWKKWMVRRIYDRARQYKVYREQISAKYTHVYGLLRVFYLLLANRLVQQSLLVEAEDIFYLNDKEVRQLAAGERLAQPPYEISSQRRFEMEQVRDVVAPEIIFGDHAPAVHLAISTRLTGTPASRGYYTGSVSVVQGLSDFNKVQPGSVLVVPYSDVGWTPLFAKAGGVISESGGLLAHASIIAREYGIPAVVSVPSATHIADGTLVTIDGFRGEVIIHK
jgi:pyruvate,water dikinase